MSDTSRLHQRARAALTALVAESGGPNGTGQIKTGSLVVLKELFTDRFVPRGQPHPDGLLVNVDGWHAFQELVEIADPNRWDRLRAAVYSELEDDGWDRINKPRGSQFVIPRRLLDGAGKIRPVVILTWNPDNWGSDEEWESLVDSWPTVPDSWTRWSTGHRSSGISPGDHAVLLRQGRERGLLAIGQFTTECFTAPHWNDENKDGNYADIDWKQAVHIDDRIPTDELIELVPEVPWNSLFASGVQAPPAGARKVLDLCRGRFGEDVDEPLPSNLPDPDSERRRLQGLESWAHFMLSSVLAGGRPPGWNRRHGPSEFGREVIRVIDEMTFGDNRADPPDLYWEFRLDKRPQDDQNGWPDIAMAWPDRIMLVELKTDPGSIRDGQLDWYLQLGAVNHPNSQIDMLFITRDPVPEPPPDMPTGARYANLTWRGLAGELTTISEICDDGDRQVISRYIEMLDELGVLDAGESRATPPTPTVATTATPDGWLDQAVAIAGSTARDGVQRALDVRFASWDEVKLAADRVRDSLDGTPAADHVQAWRWRTASSGEPLTTSGAEVGWELRFSRLND